MFLRNFESYTSSPMVKEIIPVRAGKTMVHTGTGRDSWILKMKGKLAGYILTSFRAVLKNQFSSQ